MRIFRPKLKKPKRKSLHYRSALAKLGSKRVLELEERFDCCLSVQMREHAPLAKEVRKAACKLLKIDYISGLAETRGRSKR
jgi:hypothetical protein